MYMKKIITTLTAAIGLQYAATCQSLVLPVQNAAEEACMITYSENSKTLVSNQSAPVKFRELTILSLPPATQSLTPLEIDFGLTGTFTFKKSDILEMYDDRDVYIEDMLTGKIFNLKTADTYSFSVNRRVPGRFVLHIDNMLLRYAISSTRNI